VLYLKLKIIAGGCNGYKFPTGRADKINNK